MLLAKAEIFSHSPVETIERGAKVASNPPFLDYVESAVWQDENEARLRQMVSDSHRMDAAFLAWEINRKGLTPVGFHNNGFEGYVVGRVESPEQAHDYFLDMGESIVASIYRQHKHSYKRRNQLEKAIRGESVPATIIEEWIAIFGAQIARERVKLYTNPQAMQYRDNVKRRAVAMPQIRYVLGADGELVQEYFVDTDTSPSVPAFQLDSQSELPYIVVKNIGMFGHPLLRSAATYKYR